MSDMITLVVPGGDAWQYDISHGTRKFTPFRADHEDEDSLWYVTVPREAAGPMLHNGGYRLAPTQTVHIVRSSGDVRLISPTGAGCSWGGMAFIPDEDGVVTVPTEAAGELMESHGFVAAPPKPDPISDPLMSEPMSVHEVTDRRALRK